MNSEVNKIERPTLHGKIKRIPRIDETLTKAGFCADAKVVGDILRGEQRAVNFSYDSNGNGLNAETIQEALDELNNVKAPVGYVEAVYEVSTLADFNAKVSELEGKMDVKTVKRYVITKSEWDNSFPSADYFVEIRKAWHGYSTVTARGVSEGNQIVLHRALNNNAWREWEWENPLMKQGVEYLTTERWDGKPVYTQILPIGSWAKGGTIDYDISPHVIRYGGYIGNWTIPFIHNTTDNANSVWATFYNNAGKLRLGMQGGNGAEGMSGLIQIWYYKI